MATSSNYGLGSICLMSFDPAIGSEIRKTRPAVIISGTIFNQRSKVTVLPITSSSPRDRLLPVVLPIIPYDSNGISLKSFVVCIDPMTFDKRRLVKYLGELASSQIQGIQQILSNYLDLTF